MPTRAHLRLIAAVLILTSLPTGGCVERETPAPATPQAREPAPEPSAWRSIADSPQVAVPTAADDAGMRAAINEARQSADDARSRWRATDDRQRWAVKWAAPTEDDGVEYVWVAPESWSAFRIEGRLASPPQRPLACGRGLDEAVAFPIDELIDWVHFLEGRFDGPREGGYTIALLEERFGVSPAADDQ